MSEVLSILSEWTGVHNYYVLRKCPSYGQYSVSGLGVISTTLNEDFEAKVPPDYLKCLKLISVRISIIPKIFFNTVFIKKKTCV